MNLMQPVRESPGNWLAMLIFVTTAEVATTLAVVVLRSPELGCLFLAAAISSGYRWARSHQKYLHGRARERLRTATFLLASQRYAEAWSAANDVVTAGRGPELRNTALHTLAWIALGEGEPGRAVDVLRRVLPAESIDPYTLAAVESASEHPERAIAILEHATRTTTVGREGLRLLVDLHAGAGNYPRVAAITREFSKVLGPEDVRQVACALERAGEPELAASLAAAAFSLSLSEWTAASPPLGPLAGVRKRTSTSPHGTR
jgi:hypothetical protein